MIEFDNILTFVQQYDGFIVNESCIKPITNVKPIGEATENSLVFIDKKAKNKEKLIADTHARTIICDCVPVDDNAYKDKCLIVVGNPKLFFARLVNQQLTTFTPQIHPSAVISKSADIADSCYIGPHVVIGENVKIGKGTFIHSNCSIYDNVKIGKNVIIDAGCSIGAAGFGFVRDDATGEPIRFPQLGSVEIEDNVEIGANTSIDRGALQNTIIHKGVKIDNLVHVGHNTEIGEYTYVIATTAIGGSVKIGKRCWIAPSRLLNKIAIGDDVMIGYGANVLKSVPTGATYMGDPAIEVEGYSKIQYQLRKISKKGKL